MSKTLKTLVAAAALAAATVASATPIIGTLNLGFGGVIIRTDATGKGNIDWAPPVNDPFTGAATYGQFFTNDLFNTGSFQGGVFSGSTGPHFLHDLSENIADTGNYFPVGTSATPLKQVVDLTSLKPNWRFDAYELVAGFQVAPGVFLPYNLQQQGQNVFASITINGLACEDSNANGVCDVGVDDVTKFTLALSSQYNNTTVGALLTALNGPSKSLQANQWSGTLTATSLPEPASLALVGLAIAGLGVASRRRAAK